jgi:hypothetical protein
LSCREMCVVDVDVPSIGGGLAMAVVMLQQVLLTARASADATKRK